MTGLVVKATGSFYHVKYDEGKIIPCQDTRKTCVCWALKLQVRSQWATRWRLELPPGDDFGMIVSIAERKNYIIRKSVKLSKQIQVMQQTLTGMGCGHACSA